MWGVEPYFARAGVRLYLGDCRGVVEWLAADVLVTDPPYGMAYRSGWSGASVVGDQDVTARDEALALWRDRPALVFGRWSLPRPAGTRVRLVWDKGEWPGMGDLQLPWGSSDEEVYVLGRGFTGTRMGTVIRTKRLGAALASHPTEKPVELLERLVERCPPGIIADPFCGSGSTLQAAMNLGRDAIGVEVDERYCEQVARRLSQEVLPFASV